MKALHTLADNIASFVCRADPTRDEDHEIYTYGIELLLSSAINLILVLATAIILGKFFETLCFLGSYISIRQYAGGVHAKTHLGCILSFYSIYMLNLAALSLSNVDSRLFIYTAVTISWLCVMILGTIKHHNRPLSKKEHMLFSRRARISATLVAVVILVLDHLSPHQGQIFLSFAASGMLMTSVVLILGWLLQYHKGRRNENEETA